jgi:uncharacterized membrane protein YebE (DUF533 family)
MSFGNILNQILQDGLGQSPQTQTRVANAGRNLEGGSSGGGGIDAIFGQIQDALGRAGIDTAGAGQAAGGFADKARDFLRKDQVGGLSGAQVGGIGALAGALLGGGLGGAAKGGAMAVLGTLALTALRSAQARSAGGVAPDTSGGGIRFDPEEVRSLVAPDSEKLALQAMISAAKADGQIDRTEMEKVVQRISADDVTEEERRFVTEELKKPIDIPALARAARTPAQAAEVYAASLLAIHVDTPEEVAYLRDLAAALNLDGATVAELHRLTGAPA